MHKARQLVAVQNHSAATGLAAQDIFNVFYKRVVVVMQRNERVALRVGKRPQRPGEFAGDFMQAAGGRRSHQNADNRRIQRAGDFVLGGVREFGFVDKEWFAIRMSHRTQNAFRPFGVRALHEHLKEGKFT